MHIKLQTAFGTYILYGLAFCGAQGHLKNVPGQIDDEILGSCTSGELSAGPQCSSFYKCVQTRHSVRKIKFLCPPGTVFNVHQRFCLPPDSESRCEESLESTITKPQNPSRDAGNHSQDSVEQAGPPGIKPPDILPTEETVVCPQYEVDKEGVYECEEEGLFPSFRDCGSFYRCINTMGCIIKGFFFSCPRSYHYSQKNQTCVPEKESEPCHLALDAPTEPKIVPVITLDESKINKFFVVSTYWDLMEFLPNNTQQRIILPSSH